MKGCRHQHYPINQAIKLAGKNKTHCITVLACKRKLKIPAAHTFLSSCSKRCRSGQDILFNRTKSKQVR